MARVHHTADGTSGKAGSVICTAHTPYKQTCLCCTESCCLNSAGASANTLPEKYQHTRSVWCCAGMLCSTGMSLCLLRITSLALQLSEAHAIATPTSAG